MGKKGPPAVWTKGKIEEAFAGFVEKNSRLPVAREMNPQFGLPTRRTFERYMGMTAQEYAELRYPTLLSARDERHIQTILVYRNEVREWSVERLIEAENGFFQKHGRLPEPYEYTAENGLPMYSVFCKLAKEVLEALLKEKFQELSASDGQSRISYIKRHPKAFLSALGCSISTPDRKSSVRTSHLHDTAPCWNSPTAWQYGASSPLHAS